MIFRKNRKNSTFRLVALDPKLAKPPDLPHKLRNASQTSLYIFYWVAPECKVALWAKSRSRSSALDSASAMASCCCSADAAAFSASRWLCCAATATGDAAAGASPPPLTLPPRSTGVAITAPLTEGAEAARSPHYILADNTLPARSPHQLARLPDVAFICEPVRLRERA